MVKLKGLVIMMSVIHFFFLALPVEAGNTDLDVIRKIETQLGVTLEERTEEELGAAWENVGFAVENGRVVGLNLAFFKKIEDLHFLESLPELRRLILAVNPIKDISSLAGLKNLTHLDLSSTYVTDLSPLKSLAKLKKLSFWNAPVEDISPLAHLQELTHLELIKTKVWNLEPLKDLRKLELLKMRGSPVTRLPDWMVSWCPAVDLHEAFRDCPLQDPPQRFVSADRTGIRLYLGMCTGEPLDEQGKSYNQRTLVDEALRLGFDANVRATFTEDRVTELYINFGKSSDLRVLSCFPDIRTLGLMGPGVSDLSPLKRLTRLESLNLNYTGVRDLTPLVQLKTLSGIYIAHAGDVDISPLGQMNRLTRLGLLRTKSSDFSMLKNLNDLEELNLSGTPFCDMNLLKGMKKLKTLYLVKTKVSSLPEWILDWNPELDLSIVFEDCPLEDPPQEFVDRRREKLRTYFRGKD